MSTTTTKRRHPGFAAFRDHILPVLTPGVITQLREALDRLDPRLTGGVVTRPSGFAGQGQEVEQACLLGFCGMLVGCQTVAEVNAYFQLLMTDIVNRPGGALAYMNFLCLWDGYERNYVSAYLVEIIEQYQTLLIKEKADHDLRDSSQATTILAG